MFKSNVDIKFSIQEADNFVQSLSWLVYDVWYILLLYNYYSLILELFWLCGIFLWWKIRSLLFHCFIPDYI